jgi:hypothetical protein
MFRIECYCDDKKLHLVLEALEGLIHPSPKINRIVNAGFENGQMKALTEGSMVEALQAHLKKTKIKEFRAEFVKAFLKGAGWSPTSYSHCLKEAVKVGLLRRTGTGSASRYIVRGAK